MAISSRLLSFKGATHAVNDFQLPQAISWAGLAGLFVLAFNYGKLNARVDALVKAVERIEDHFGINHK